MDYILELLCWLRPHYCADCNAQFVDRLRRQLRAPLDTDYPTYTDEGDPDHVTGWRSNVRLVLCTLGRLFGHAWLRLNGIPLKRDDLQL